MKEGNGILIVMGVSASGKTTVGKALAERLSLPFFDGDDFHPPENISKMAAGLPLNDDDREGWLGRLNSLAKEHLESGAVIACSALKELYRKWLREGIEDQIRFVVMLGEYDDIAERIAKRKGHFMPPALLKSQFDTLEVPDYGIHLDCSQPAEALVEVVTAALGKTA